MRKSAFSGVFLAGIAAAFLFFTSEVLSIEKQAQGPAYKPDEIIVKFKAGAAETLEKQLSKGETTGTLKVSASLDELSRKHKAKKIQPLIKGFKAERQRMGELLKKDKAGLTKREEHLLRRLKRAPRDAKVPELDRIYKVELEEGQSAEQAVAEYKQNPDVEYAELNYIASICATPNDTHYPIQWPLNNIGQMYPESGEYNHPPGTPDCDIDAPEAWDVNTGSPEIIVAVVDTGVDYNHRDLINNMWTDSNGYHGYDFVNNVNYPMDDHGHGTHCAGIIAADGNNGLDITGVCWNTKIMAIKFLDENGYGSTSNAVKAFYYAVENGADVISNSWIGYYLSESLEEAIEYAHSQGVIMVAALGNEGWQYTGIPAYYDHVVGTAATNSSDQKPWFSNYGDWCDIAAPGVDVLSLRANGTSMGTVYDSYTTIASGTSMACPHVAGVMALIIANYPEASSEYLVERLYQSSDDISEQNPGFEGQLGAGRVNAYKAIAQGAFTGTITINSNFYSCSDTVAVEVRDLDLVAQESLDVTVTTDAGDSEIVTMNKDSNQPWVFTSTILTSSGTPIPRDDTLQVLHGQTIIAIYEDANDCTGNPAVAQATATADCQPPAIFDVEVLDITSTGARATFRTDEPTIGLVRYGLACGEPNTVICDDTVLVTYHNFYLPGLTCETQYYFEIDATDAVGNENNRLQWGSMLYIHHHPHTSRTACSRRVYYNSGGNRRCC